MKKLGLLVMPLMAVSLLASCGGGDTKTYHIKFTNGNKIVSEKDYEENEEIIAPKDPKPYEKDHRTYTFDAWYDGNTKFKSGTKATKDTEYSAKFNGKDTKYTVTFVYADGTTESVKEYISLSDLTLTAPKTKATPQEGYRYAWKASDDLIIESECSKTFTVDELKEYIFTETEVENEYTITYVLGDESAVDPGNPTKYKVSNKITLSDPTLEGFTFKGWYLKAYECDKFQYQDGWNAGDMTGNLTLYADWHVKEKTLDNDYTWVQISDISNKGEASKYFNIGDIKKVKVNEKDHDVRIIGFNQDKDKNGNDIGITFEFANLISDKNGYSLAVQWNDTNNQSTANHKYTESTIHNALNGESVGNVLWVQKGATTWSSDYKCSVLDMLNKDNPDLVNIIKAPSKWININNGDGWKEETINDKLFLLSPFETGATRSIYEEAKTTTYPYYKGAENSKRIKKQIEGAIEYEPDPIPTIPKGEGQIYEGVVGHFAGFNYKADDTGGGVYWFRSPSKYSSINSWFVEGDGYVNNGGTGYLAALSVAPAFCI